MNGAREIRDDDQETAPEVLRDLIAVATGAMIPGSVIATWTPAERRQAEEWAASEHLRASDNTGVPRRKYPRLVQEAVVLAANPGMAQLAVEAWMNRKQQVEQSEGMLHEMGVGRTTQKETADIAQAAITGLLVLLDGESGPVSPWTKALAILGSHPEGIAARDLSVLLGKDSPGKEHLDEWLNAGAGCGTLERVGYDAWKIRGTAG